MEVIISPQDRSVIVRGRQIELTKREFEIIAAIAAHGRPLSRKRLGELVWPNRTAAIASAYAKVYVLRLRRRLGRDADLIATTRLGYRLAHPYGVAPQNT